MTSLALIDGATLTAAQRLLGAVTINDGANVDADIAAFEGLLQAILFFDEVCCIDDFEKVSKRNGIAALNFITFIEKADVKYGLLWQSAHEATEHVGLRIANGKIDTSDFQSTLEQIRTHLEFDFSVRKSSTDLLVRAIADVGGISMETHQRLLSSIAHQFRSETSKLSRWDVPTFKSGDISALNNPLARERDLRIDTSLTEIAASLNWLAMKTVFYVGAADQFNMDVVLHPIRHAFLAQHILKPAMASTSMYDAVTQILRDGISGTVREITKLTEPVVSEMNLPMWCAFLATQTKNPAEFIPRCQHLREERLFVEARRQLAELRRLEEENDLAKYRTSVNRLNRELSDVSSRLLSKYGVSSGSCGGTDCEHSAARDRAPDPPQ